MNAKVRQQLKNRKRKLLRRISVQHGKWQSPMIRPANTKIELAQKQQAITCGGLATVIQLIKTLGLRKEINHAAKVLKLHLPYDEADHIFNIALNLLAGGTCLDHIEHRRNDEAYLDALGTQRIPDPTTAGEFCRRFSHVQLIEVMQAINRVRQRVWKQQEGDFFDCATIEADGTIVETAAEKKEGIGISYKGKWGYHPLVVTLAEPRNCFTSTIALAIKSANKTRRFSTTLQSSNARRRAFERSFCVATRHSLPPNTWIAGMSRE